MNSPVWNARSSARDCAVQRRSVTGTGLGANRGRVFVSLPAGSFRPVVLILEDAYDAGPLATGVLFHLHEHRKALGQGGARGFLRFEREHAPIVGPHVAPDTLAVFDFNLEHRK